MERIDKILSNAGLARRVATQKEAAKETIAAPVNGTAVKSADEKINDDDILELDGNPVNRQKFYYIMMNKPAGCICSTDDPTAPTVMSLIDEADLRRGMFPVGRLDKYTGRASDYLERRNTCTRSAFTEEARPEKIFLPP